jgi:hypothetical protein
MESLLIILKISVFSFILVFCLDKYFQGARGTKPTYQTKKISFGLVKQTLFS